MPWLARTWLGGRPDGFATCSADARAQGMLLALMTTAKVKILLVSRHSVKRTACPCHHSGPSVKLKEATQVYLYWAWLYLSSLCLHPVCQRSLAKGRHVWANRGSLSVLSTFDILRPQSEGMVSWGSTWTDTNSQPKLLQFGGRSCAIPDPTAGKLSTSSLNLTRYERQRNHTRPGRN